MLNVKLSLHKKETFTSIYCLKLGIAEYYVSSYYYLNYFSFVILRFCTEVRLKKNKKSRPPKISHKSSHGTQTYTPKALQTYSVSHNSKETHLSFECINDELKSMRLDTLNAFLHNMIAILILHTL